MEDADIKHERDRVDDLYKIAIKQYGNTNKNKAKLLEDWDNSAVMLHDVVKVTYCYRLKWPASHLQRNWYTNRKHHHAVLQLLRNMQY